MDRYTEAFNFPAVAVALAIFGASTFGGMALNLVLNPTWPVAVALCAYAVCAVALVLGLRALARVDSERRVTALAESVAAAITVAEEAKKAAEKAQSGVSALAARPAARPSY